MLQIISGKFFTGNDRYVHDGKGVTYSNYAWVAPLATCVATLEPVDTVGSVASYVISYKNQIEKHAEGSFGLVRTGDHEIVNQFELLCTFGLRAFFHQDRATVAINCRDKPLSAGDQHVPSAFIPRFFAPQLRGTSEDTEAFPAFVEKVIGLPRKVYLPTMACLRSFTHALQLVGHNIDLAYTLLIYSLECLSQSFDEYEATWEDYRDEVRVHLDRTLKDIEPDVANSIRDALLRDSNLKLQQRFIQFVGSHIDDRFFMEQAPIGNNALRKSDLPNALRNAYRMRSGFVHQLLPIQEQLRIPQLAKGDVLVWDNGRYLSLRGVVRLAHHVITEFIQRQESLEQEDIAWRDELSGVVRMKMAPQYWIWKHEGFHPDEATQRLSGFLSQFETISLSGDSLTDIRKLLETYETMLPNVTKQVRIRMLATSLVWNRVVSPKEHTPNWENMFDRYQELFDECSIETMLTSLLTEEEWAWQADECTAQWRGYESQRFRPKGLSIPPLMELALQAWISMRTRHLETMTSTRGG